VNRATRYIFAFGAVVYEMVTDKRAFPGEDLSETLAHVLTKEPEWEALPPEAPAALRQVLRVWLTKDAKSRVRDIADVRLESARAHGRLRAPRSVGIERRGPLPARR
jgi:hypothetical protein